ncbi:MAG TPA: FAD/NAD(P)-binding protein [Steroidobacteraceae bacterium]|nr:FAD/NAD(P)-binding protein [Steroidobacteraceae bacterium]
MTAQPRTIVIVGAGFSGTAVAINLLRLSRAGNVRIVLVDRSQVARGVAYAPRDYPYLLNVPAGRMSASSCAPSEFLTFAQRWLPGATADHFLPRELYGRYLEWTLRSAELASAPHARLERVQGRVSRIERAAGSLLSDVHLADGRRFAADDVVLALGNPPPARLPGTEALVGSAQYAENPWNAPPFRAGETVLVIGTGLTMADIVIAGADRSQGDAVVHAISRHGLVPPEQTAFRHAHTDHDGAALLRAAARSTRQLLRATRELSDEVERRGGDWREAITHVRSLAPALWQRMPIGERRRFLRHVRVFWDIHRHRLPDSTAATLRQLSRTGKLHVHAGRVVRLALEDYRVCVTWRARGERKTQSLLVDRVINCTGPDYDPRRSRDPLLCSLLADGTAVADPLGIGLRTGPCGALIDARGRAAANLFYIGPMLRADHWEATAVQELRGHAEQLAYHLSARELQATTPALEAS